jgi:hypothetical protein
MRIKIGGEKRKVWLEKTFDGIDFCIDDICRHTCIARLTLKGELVIYRDAADFLNRETHNKCIITKKEWE